MDHDPGVRWLRVWRAYRVVMRRVYRMRREDYARAVEARRVQVAYRALRTRAQRREILTDLAVQPGWLWRTVAHPELVALADAALPPLPPYGPFDDGPALDLMEACDRRALVREAAALRLERAEAGVLPWPRRWLGRVWWRAWHGRPGWY